MTKKDFFNYFFSLGLILSVVLIGWNIKQFESGYHIYDYGCNLKYINEVTGENFQDQMTDGKVYNYSFLLRLGAIRLRTSFYKIIPSVLAFTLCFAYLIMRLKW